LAGRGGDFTLRIINKIKQHKEKYYIILYYIILIFSNRGSMQYRDDEKLADRLYYQEVLEDIERWKIKDWVDQSIEEKRKKNVEDWKKILSYKK
jgi:hypothetical protein